MKFPIANSIKMNDDGSIPIDENTNFRNTLYQNFDSGVNQKYANEDYVNCVMFRNIYSITLQIIYESALSASTFTFSGKDYTGAEDDITFGSLSSPQNGASSEELLDNGEYVWYNMTIPTSGMNSGYWYLKAFNFFTDESYTSETFYVSDAISDIALGNDVIRLKYKNDNGFEKDYYWTDGNYQEMLINCAHNTGLDFDTETEQAEGEKSSELLESNTRKKITRTVLGVPSYLYEKIVKASYSTDLYVNGEAMVCDSIAKEGDQYSDLSNLTITYKEKTTTNTY